MKNGKCVTQKNSKRNSLKPDLQPLEAFQSCTLQFYSGYLGNLGTLILVIQLEGTGVQCPLEFKHDFITSKLLKWMLGSLHESNKDHVEMELFS